MNSKSIIKALVCLSSLLISTAAFAYLTPGQGSGSGKPSEDPNRPGQYNPPPQQGGGHGGGGHGGGGHGGGGGYNPPPQNGGGHGGGHGGGYYPPQPPPHHGGGHGGGYYPPPPPPSNPYYPPTPPPPSNPYYPPAPGYGQRVVQQVYVGRSIQNEMYQLSYWANLNTQYYGWEVSAVRASTRPNSPYTTVAQLVTSDNRVLASEVNPGYEIALFPSYQVFAGYQELYLYIQGSTYIESIEVELIRR